MPRGRDGGCALCVAGPSVMRISKTLQGVSHGAHRILPSGPQADDGQTARTIGISLHSLLAQTGARFFPLTADAGDDPFDGVVLGLREVGDHSQRVGDDLHLVLNRHGVG